MKARTLLIAGLVLMGMTAPANPSAQSRPETVPNLYLPSALQWSKGPPGLPVGAQVVVMEGDPSKPGLFTMRLKLPDGYRIPPHWHSQVEHITVLEGTLQLGHGEHFDPKILREMPPGSFAFIPTGHRHFAMAKGETLIQLHGIGPWQIYYVNPSDDPRGPAGAR